MSGEIACLVGALFVLPALLHVMRRPGDDGPRSSERISLRARQARGLLSRPRRSGQSSLAGRTARGARRGPASPR
jgi:hypothetical protein